MDFNFLKMYSAKAKTENKSIFEHNNNLINIKNEILDIYDIEKINNSLMNSINYHDIGKCVDAFQSNIEGKSRTVRHEIHSASVKGLSKREKVAILTHHKGLEDLELNVRSKYYLEEQEELKGKIPIEFENIKIFIQNLIYFDEEEKEEDILKDLDTILLKGYLNLCDHLGSAGIKKVDKGLSTVSIFKYKFYNSIQRKVLAMEEKEDILIIARTGLGKTATAMYWSDLVQNKEKSKRIYYLLPFTASINSLYKDMNELGVSVAMLHSKAEYFLTKYKSDFTKDDYQYFKKSVKQVNICTIFQLVKSMFSCKRFEMIIAQMKNSIFIIDEIHCFDIKELCYILEMLRWLKINLGVRICVMSASIPAYLQKLIKDRLDITREITAEEEDFIERHRITSIKKNIIDDLDKVKKELDENKKVLLCVNNVNLAQELYKRFSIRYNTKIIHGRFNARDREKAENGLKNHAGLLIGTQAIEVSLDIDYDVMFTEIAPFDALLQRFGRVNRKGVKGLSDIYIYDNSNDFIYDESIIKNTDKVLEEIIRNDKRIILEEKVNYYLDKVYTQFNLEEYNNIKCDFLKMIKGLRVGFYNNDAIDEMCQIDTINILPKCLFDEYVKFIKDKKYLEAESLKLNIRKKKMFIDKRIFDYNKEYKVLLANYKYDENIGLVFEEDIDGYFM